MCRSTSRAFRPASSRRARDRSIQSIWGHCSRSDTNRGKARMRLAQSLRPIQTTQRNRHPVRLKKPEQTKMKRAILRSVSVALIAGFTAASGTVMSAPLARPSSFDGNWSVVIHTRQGDCGESLRYSLRIVGGQVQSGEQNYRAAGAVSANGAIRVMVAEGDRAPVNVMDGNYLRA